MQIDTIVAQATPPGRGSVGIVRVSGPLAYSLGEQVTRSQLQPRYATYTPFYDHQDELIDQGIALFFQGPHSFTGEDILELQGHGGQVVIDSLIASLLQLGCRLARPGEFSERAFLNGKMDLAQAEAVADLINATSTHAARLALRSLQGEFSQVVNDILGQLIQLRIYVEAAIDFSEEEIDVLATQQLLQRGEQVAQAVDNLKAKAKQGSFLQEGITAIIMGEPNVGKSSLLNRLAGKEVAIVTPIAGTTRDVIRDYVLIDDMPMHIVDTAGLRESEDLVEQIGIERAYQAMQQADLLLYVQDCSAETSILPKLSANIPCLIIKNKIDQAGMSPELLQTSAATTIYLSAKTGDGIELLKQAIKQTVGYQTTNEGIYLARRRHLDALERAGRQINESMQELSYQGALELAAEHLRLAQLALNEITGEFTADDLLGRIFSSFCIGK